MKKLFLILVFLIPISNLFSTPNQSNWGRFIYIGDNEQNYFCHFILRTYPGTYYDFTDSVFICRLSSKTGKMEEKQLLSVTVHKDTTTYNHWSHITNTTGFPVEKYLKENEVWYKFSSTDLKDYTFVFKDGNLLLEKYPKSYTISGMERNIDCVKKVVDNSRWYNIEMFKHYNEFFNKQAKVVEYYKNDRYYFFVVCIGSGYIDSNYFQYILPLPVDIVNKAVGEIEKKKIQK